MHHLLTYVDAMTYFGLDTTKLTSKVSSLSVTAARSRLAKRTPPGFVGMRQCQGIESPRGWRWDAQRYDMAMTTICKGENFSLVSVQVAVAEMVPCSECCM